MGNVMCRMESGVECEVGIVEYEVWSVKCRVWSVECGECEVWSVEGDMSVCV